MIENAIDGPITVMYLHGYGSRFDPRSEKMRLLVKLGAVVGPDLDYGHGPDAVRHIAREFALAENVDLIVGTSMGGWLASHAGAELGIPFVSLNPAIRPSQTLRKHVGKPVNYDGFEATIDADTAAAYEDFHTGAKWGLILCEEEDDVLDAYETVAFLKPYYSTRLIPGGSHRFSSLAAHLEAIRSHWLHAVMCQDDLNSD